MTAGEYERAAQRLAALKFLRDASIDADEQSRILTEMDGIAQAMAASIVWPPGVRGDSAELEAANHAREMENFHAFAQIPDTRRAEMERAGRWPKIPDPPWLAELDQATPTTDADDNGRAAEQAALESELQSIHERFHSK